MHSHALPADLPSHVTVQESAYSHTAGRASDRLAIGAMAWLQREGYRVTEDIAVTGCDNIPDSEFTFPPLTTVNMHKTLLGEIAAERLAKRLENPAEVYLNITTPTELVVRQSCGAYSRKASAGP